MFFSSSTRRHGATDMRLCLRYFGRDLSRYEVARLSDAFAAVLVESGFVAGDRLVLALQNTPGFVIALLGAWKAGGIVVPVNPMVRGPELAFVFSDSGARFLVASSDMAAVIADGVAAAEHVEIFWSDPTDFAGRSTIPFVAEDARTPDLGRRIDESMLAAVGPMDATVRGSLPASGDVAVICYTSGTTGPPKGAMLSHGNLSYQADVAAQRFGLAEGDPVLALAPLFHITGLAQHFALSVANGLPLVLTHRFHPETVLHLIEETPPAFTVAAITAFVALATASGENDSRLKLLTNVVSGGAPVPAAVVQDLERRFGFYIRNGYGMTETASATVGVSIGTRAPVDARKWSTKYRTGVMSTRP